MFPRTPRRFYPFLFTLSFSFGALSITPIGPSVAQAQKVSAAKPVLTEFGGNQTFPLSPIVSVTNRAKDKKLVEKINADLAIVFGNDPKAQAQLTNATITNALVQLEEIDSNDDLDFKNPKGRFALTYYTLKNAAPDNENRIYDSLESADGILAPIYAYENEVKDPNRQHLGKDKQMYARVNSALWKAAGNLDQVTPADIKAFVPKLDKALAVLPHFSGIIFRGEGMSEEQLKAARDRKVIFHPSFTSATLDIGDALNFARLSSDPAKKRVLMIIQGKGPLTAFSSDYMMEEEIIIPRNATFDVVRIDEQVKEFEGWVFLYLRQRM